MIDPEETGGIRMLRPTKTLTLLLLLILAGGSGLAAVNLNLTFDYSLSPSTSPTTAPASDITVKDVVTLDLSLLWRVDEKMKTGFGLALGTWPMQLDGGSVQNKVLLDVYLAVSEYRVELKKGISFVLLGRGGFSSYDLKEWATTVKVLAGFSFAFSNLELDVLAGLESRYFSLSKFLYSGYPVGMSLKFQF